MIPDPTTMSKLDRPTSFTAELNGQPVLLAPGQSVLDAALQAGLPMRYRCRVGGCGSCKCRLQAGEVLQRTDTSYLLSAEELAEGVILACQSEARTDLRIAYEPEPDQLPWQIGRIDRQRALSDAVVELVLQLDSPWQGQAGQHAALCVIDDEAIVRDLTPIPSADGRELRFLIRLVEGGRLSHWLRAHDRHGRSVQISAGRGELMLDEADTPVLMVATGTGLAPMLALLAKAQRDQVSRPITLLFGLRSEADLVMASPWLAQAPDNWLLLPVLSQAGPGWAGLRGHVQEHLVPWLTDAGPIRLCGLPAMTDAVLAVLQQAQVAPTRVRFDRFDEGPSSLQAPALLPAAVATRPPANWFDYAKYLGFHGIGLISLVSLLAGGVYTTLGLIGVVAAYILGDALGGDDVRTPDYRAPRWLTWQLWAALPLLCMIVLAAVWSVSADDRLGLGAWLSPLLGYDLLAARDATTSGQHLAGVILTGLMIGLIGTIPAHELVHRTWDRASVLIGRWLLAFSFDASFSIEHVYGHHRYVATEEDPATAPRGRNVYWHIVRSTWLGNISAWTIEVERLRKRHLPRFSRHNAVLQGYAMSLLLLALAFAVGGWVGLGFFVAAALWGKALLEIVNYMEHYGLVRVASAPVAPRHSWNTNRRVSSWTMFNLTRHSHHHAEGEVSYPELRPYPDAPMMVSGYLTTIIIALIPPLWHAAMRPKLREWDARYANADEQRLANAAEVGPRQSLS